MSEQEQSFYAPAKHYGPHGLAVWWWFLTNGIDPQQVKANQEVRVITTDKGESTAFFQAFTVDMAGRRILRADGYESVLMFMPVKYTPDIYGLPTAGVAAWR